MNGAFAYFLMIILKRQKMHESKTVHLRKVTSRHGFWIEFSSNKDFEIYRWRCKTIFDRRIMKFQPGLVSTSFLNVIEVSR